MKNTFSVISRRLRLVRPLVHGTIMMLVMACSGLAQAGDIEAGREKSATCAACHGAEGIGEITSYPILAGQYESYLAHALKSYRDGSRDNAIMAGFAAALSDEDIADLAAFFAAQEGPLTTARSE